MSETENNSNLSDQNENGKKNVVFNVNDDDVEHSKNNKKSTSHRKNGTLGKALKKKLIRPRSKDKEEMLNIIPKSFEDDGTITTRPRGRSVFDLSNAQRAFLPVYVQQKLQDAKGVPKAPSLEKGEGAIMFVDISGFTALGNSIRKRKGISAAEAAEILAKKINDVLRRLTEEVQNFNGDVAKFAGDALLCMWLTDKHVDNMQQQLDRAKSCAVVMLKAVKEINPQLDLHGGIATGTLMHIHLGDPRGTKLRWYLITGEAVVKATDLVDQAPRGHILYQPYEDMTEHLINTDLDLGIGLGYDEEEAKMDPLNLEEDSEEKIISSEEGKTETSPKEEEDEEARALSVDKRKKSTVQVLTKNTAQEVQQTRSRVATHLDEFIQKPLGSYGLPYIPQSLRTTLQHGHDEPEMRRRVAIVFAMLPDLTATEEELKSQSLSYNRLHELNDSFTTLVAISRKYDGEVRDLLFDDKGCVFIAVFGAHSAIEMPELKATKAALSMAEELENVKLGVSTGTCFVGMCGNETRHDFIVMGHEVNMAARYMGKAPCGQVYCTRSILDQTSEFFAYEEVTVQLKKKQNDHLHDLDGEILKAAEEVSSPSPRKNKADQFEHADSLPVINIANASTSPKKRSQLQQSKAVIINDPNGLAIAYHPLKDIARRPSFLATYRYGQLFDVFVGRKNELKKIESHINKISKEKGNGTVLLVAPAGMGKSALLRKIRHSKAGKYKSVLATAFALELDTKFYAFRQIIESEFGIFQDMPKSKAKGIIKSWVNDGFKPNLDVLEEILPYIKTLLGHNTNFRGSAEFSTGKTPRRIRGLITSMRLPKGLGSSKNVTAALEGELGSVNEKEQNNKRPTTLQDSNQKESSGSMRNLLPGFKRKPTIKNKGLAAVAAKQAAAEITKQKHLKQKSNAPDQMKVISSQEIEAAMEVMIGLLKIASRNALKTGSKSYLVVFEDLQWMDIPSLQVLQEILKRCSIQKVLPATTFIFTSRPLTKQHSVVDSVKKESTLRNLLFESVYNTVANTSGKNNIQVKLAGLSKGAVGKIVNAALIPENSGFTVAKELIDGVFVKTDGFPLHVILLLRWLPENDGIELDDQKTWKLKGKKVTTMVLRSEATAAIIGRFDALDPFIRNALKIATVFGMEFSQQELLQVINKDIENKAESRYQRSNAITIEYLLTALKSAQKEGFVKKSGYYKWKWASTNILQYISELLTGVRRIQISDIKEEVKVINIGDGAALLMGFTEGL